MSLCVLEIFSFYLCLYIVHVYTLVSCVCWCMCLTLGKSQRRTLQGPPLFLSALISWEKSLNEPGAHWFMTRLANSKPQCSYLHAGLLSTELQVIPPTTVFLCKGPSYLNSEPMLVHQWNFLSRLPKLLQMLRRTLLKFHVCKLIRLHTNCIKFLLVSLIQRGGSYIHPSILYRQWCIHRPSIRQNVYYAITC